MLEIYPKICVKMDPNFPFRVTQFFSSLADSDPHDPIRMQFMPSDNELTVLPYETADPLAEGAHSPVPRLIHRYSSRALVLVTDECAIHCRYCFRRYFTGTREGALSAHQLDDILAYVDDHAEIDEILLSGGDPLTLDDDDIGLLLSRFRSVRGSLVLRICSRIPSVLPNRIKPDLCKQLAASKPVWVIGQFNHPREITPECAAALEAITDHGIPILSQTVLLKGINDDADLLAKLFRSLVRNHVKPYYLFQGDLVRGTSHFRVPLSRSLEIVDKLMRLVSRLAMPIFAVDIPNGGGKIELTDTTVSETDDGWFLLHGKDGVLGRYPVEGE